MLSNKEINLISCKRVRCLIDYVKAKCFEVYEPGLHVCINERMLKCWSRSLKVTRLVKNGNGRY